MSGFRQSGDDGSLIFDSAGGGVAKIFGEFSAGSAAGTVTDDRLRSGEVFIFPKRPLSSGTPTTPSFTLGDNSISWPASSIGIPTMTYLYGTGAVASKSYVSSHVPGTAGFRCFDEAGNFVLDETFLTYHYLGSMSASLFSGQVAPLDIPFGIDSLPIIAFRGATWVVILNATSIDASTTRLIIKTGPSSSTVRFYFFSDARFGTSRGIGQRWFDNAGNLRGDSSIPLLRVRQTLSFNNWYGNDSINDLPAGRQFAVVMNAGGALYTIVPGGTGGSGDGSVWIAGGRVTNDGTRDIVTISPLLVRGPGGGTESGRSKAIYSIVDVTGV